MRVEHLGRQRATFFVSWAWGRIAVPLQRHMQDFGNLVLVILMPLRNHGFHKRAMLTVPRSHALRLIPARAAAAP